MFTRKVADENSKLTKKQRNGLLYALFWQISLPMVEIFKRLRVTPNQVTVWGFLCYMAAGFCFYTGSQKTNVLGAVIFLWAVILDCTDGKLARATEKTSHLGVWLDYNLDYLKYLFIYPPMTMAIFRETGDPLVFILGFVIVITILTYVIITQRFGEFPFAQEEVQTISHLPFHWLAKQFYAYELIEAVLLLGFAMMNSLHLFLIVWSIYFVVFYLGTAFILGRTIAKHDF